MFGKFDMRHRSKKGVSLVFVIAVAIALVIFSAALFAAASRSLDLTGRSVDDRQTYLTAKSAVEYAKAAAYSEAQGGSLADFAVKAGKNGFQKFIPAAGTDVDSLLNGTTYCAVCKNSGGNVNVKAKVKDSNSQRYRLMNFTFHIEFPTISGYLATGTQYKDNKFLHENGMFAPDGASDFPVLIQQKMEPSGNANSLQAPEIYFMKGIDFGGQRGDAGTQVDLQADFIYFGGNVTSGNSGHELYISVFSASDGILWFDNVDVTPSDDLTERVHMNGVYKYTSDIGNLLSTPELNKLKANPAQPSDYAVYSSRVAYYKKNANNIVSGETPNHGGIGWTADGRLLGADQVSSCSDQSGKDVYLYVDKDKEKANQAWTGNITYTAKTVALYYNGDSSNPFVVRDTKAFKADTVWLNEQSGDGPPEDDTDSDDNFQLKALDTNSHLYVYSTDGKSPVKIILPHALKVLDKNGNEKYQVINSSNDPANPSSYTYTVPSGTDLLNASASAFTFGGSGGGGGGFTISGGTYKEP